MKLLSLSNSSRRVAVDDEDYERCKLYKWRLDINIVRGGPSYRDKLSNFIMKDSNNKYDHKDLNPLNNQKSNLRICTHSQNMANRRKFKGTSSKYKGVYWHIRDKIWIAEINANQKKIYLGSYKSEIAAARKYNEEAPKYFGEFARLNIIE
jgi:hypothetical protein